MRKQEENKAAGGPAENKSVIPGAAPQPLQPGSPEYLERLRAGRHYEPALPNPFGSQPPDLGTAKPEQIAGARVP